MRLTVTWRGPAAKKAILEGGAHGLRDATDHLLGEARKIVPLENADLQRSGRSEVDPRNLTGLVGFGRGPSQPVIAIVQHERLDYRHLPGRKARYLADPLQEQQRRMQEMIANQIKRRLK